jgi:septal ring factor EnvC (AmiA/AmiB activator)
MAVCHLAFGLCSATDRKEYDREIARQKRELEEIRSRLQQEQQELEDLKEQKASTLGHLDKLSNNIHLTETYLAQLETTEETLNQSLTVVKQDLTEVEARLKERNGVISRRVRTLFMSGGPDRVVLEGWKAGHGDFLRKVFFMKRVIRYDKTLVQANQEDMQLKKKAMTKLDNRINETLRFREHKAKEKEKFSRAKKEQEKALASIQLDEEAKREALKEMEENANLINEIIDGLEKRRQAEIARNKKATELEKGSKYCLPVEGEVVSKYGLQYHATLKTSTKNLGIEIRGKSGTPVRAAVSGEVALITRIPGYGMGIILDNGSGFFTIYANLAGIRVRQGEKVKTCQDLATVSVETGRVYFEVRKGTRTLDPVDWLGSSGK